jgi:hypothetical protein
MAISDLSCYWDRPVKIGPGTRQKVGMRLEHYGANQAFRLDGNREHTMHMRELEKGLSVQSGRRI